MPSLTPDRYQRLRRLAAEATAARSRAKDVAVMSTETRPAVADSWTLADLQRANAARQAEWCLDQKPDLSFRGNELAGEVGEACNVIKKLERERQGWRGSRATIDQLRDELADVVICTVLVANEAGIDLYPAVRAKFNDTSRKNGLTTFLDGDGDVAGEWEARCREAWSDAGAAVYAERVANERIEALEACLRRILQSPVVADENHSDPAWGCRETSEAIAAARALLDHHPIPAGGDDPALDGTDWTHPAWWRGHDQSVVIMCHMINQILDGADTCVGVSQEPWEATRRRLLALVRPATDIVQSEAVKAFLARQSERAGEAGEGPAR